MPRDDLHLLKKHYILCLFMYLKENTDINNTTTIEKLKIALEEEYDIDIEQKAIRSNLKVLEELGFPIRYATTIKRSSSDIKTDIYYDHWEESGISESELYLLIDSVLASKYVNENQANNIAKWLVDQGPISFRKKRKYFESSNYGYHTENQNVFLNVEIISEAIDENKKVTFNYKEYGTDDKLKTVRANVKVSPYYTAMHNGIYYLICNVDGSDELEPFRMDKLFDVAKVEERSVNIKSIAPGFDIKTYLESHVYMFPGKEQFVKVRIKTDCFSNLHDFFGKKINVDYTASDDEYAVVTFKANLEGLFYWALQYGENAEIIEPQEVRDRVRETVTQMARTYTITEDDKYSVALSRRKERYSRLILSRIDLRNRHEHETLQDFRGLEVGYNNIDNYDFINNYKNLRVLGIWEPWILNTLNLDLPNLRYLSVSGRKGSIENFDSIKNCPNIKTISIHETRVKSWDAVYDLKELEILRGTAESFNNLDLSKFPQEPTIINSNSQFIIIEFKDTINRHSQENHGIIRNIVK